MNKCLKCQSEISNEPIYGLHSDCFVSWFKLEVPCQFKDLDPKRSTSYGTDLTIQTHRNTFFHGNYLKYSATLGKTEYILKVQEPKYPELPLVEYICNQIAELLKIDIPPHHLIHYNNRMVFVTRNFMQDYTGTLHHIYKFLPAGEENHSCEEIIKVILKQTSKLSEVVKFVEICLFDSFIGNNDRHGRNLGIIETSSFKILAPMYDNPSCLGIEDDFFLQSDANPSGSIWTKTSKEPKPIDYINEFNRLGYSKIVLQFCKKIHLQFTKITNLISDSGLNQLRKNALITLLQKRLGDFQNGK